MALEVRKEIDAETVVKMLEDSYVDDNLSGGSPEEVMKIKGNLNITYYEEFQYDGSLK